METGNYKLKNNIIYLLFALLMSGMTLFASIHSLTSTSENSFRFELQITLLILMHVVFFLISIVLDGIIMQIDMKYTFFSLSFSLVYVILLYLPFLSTWGKIFQYHDYGIITILLIKILIPLTIIQLIWVILYTVKILITKSVDG
ncbi:hypothetical protein [Vallitalea maricola]|uniref:Uncharacterized protein n=1 Tax=Vallitalea maricola TaxID=3074433 RepID=A0ACB5ULV2_9FIRM|nr:hypothetical protein AN2V17_30780 [Vallitalea sp. AN17-2]